MRREDHFQSAPQAVESTCSISGVWRWRPTLYAATLSLHSENSDDNFNVRPAPDTPLFESITISAVSIRPAFKSGARAKICARRITAGIGDQPGLLDRFAKQLRQAVNGFGQPIGIVVRLAIPLGKDGRIAQPVIGEVDDRAPPDRSCGTSFDVTPCGKQLKTHSARLTTASGDKSSRGNSSRLVSEGCTEEIGGLPS